MYTSDMFKEEMYKLLKEGYDPVIVAKKASRLFFEYRADTSHALDEKMLDIMTMEDGPEFEMTEEEFVEFLENL